MTVQEFVNIDKDLQTVQDISDVNIIILIYLCIKHVLFILMYLYKCKMHVRRVESFSFHMFT
jgi:ABC-type amino acid transport system permease subunit